MLTGAAASSTSFSLGQDDSLRLDMFSHTSWCFQLDKSFRDMASITRLLPFHNIPFSFIITIFVLLSCFQWFAFKNGWHYLENDRETTLWSARGNLSRLRAAKSPSNRCICCTSTSLLHVSCLLLMFTAQFIYDRIHAASRNYGTPVLSASHRVSHANCTVWRKLGTEVGVNSCLVALIATESVSIALSWLLLPPEVGVNRHGLLGNHNDDLLNGRQSSVQIF